MSKGKGWGDGKKALSPTHYLGPRYNDPLAHTVIIQVWAHPIFFPVRSCGCIEDELHALEHYCAQRQVPVEILVQFPPTRSVIRPSLTKRQLILYARVNDDESDRNTFETRCRRRGFQTRQFTGGLYFPGESPLGKEVQEA